MPISQELEEMLESLTAAEKAQVLQRVALNLSHFLPGIDSDPNVCGGEPRVLRTRIPIWLLEQARRIGTTESDLLRSYPSLKAQDLVNAWAYVDAHRTEIDQQIRENEEA